MRAPLKSRSKIDLLRSQYENFYMLNNESIDEMLTRFTKIIFLGDESTTTKK